MNVNKFKCPFCGGNIRQQFSSLRDICEDCGMEVRFGDKTNKEERLQELTAFWYDYIGCNHHKDSDCNFYINKVWSYGNLPVYRPEHYGYMASDFTGGMHETYEEALDELIAFVEEEVKDAHKVPHNWQDTNKHDYNWAGVVKVIEEHKLYPISIRP